MNSNLPQEIWDHELTSRLEPGAVWLWHGLVARANLTLLTAMSKSGKTTLLSMLLARRHHGGTLAGLAVEPGKTVVISEEDSALWADRARQRDFGGKVCIISRPFITVPQPNQWHALIARILQLREQHGVDLLVIDPLAPLLRCENHPRAIFEMLLPLAALTRRGMAVLVMHHPSKGQPGLGQAPHGSGALVGHVDISIELRHPGGNPLTRRRRFLALSRHAETPRQLLLELNPESTDYLVVAEDGQENDFQANWEVLRMIFEDAPQKLTREDILGEWPADYDKPSATTLRKWLERAVDRGLVAWEGSGRKADPFRYWFPTTEAVWRERFPFYEEIQQQMEQFRLPFQSLTERKRVDRETEIDLTRSDGDDGLES